VFRLTEKRLLLVKLENPLQYTFGMPLQEKKLTRFSFKKILKVFNQLV
jgi:hypothetical protein